MSKFNILNSTKKPWILVTKKSISYDTFFTSVLRLELDGIKMSTEQSVLKEFSEVCQFPDYFGKNFDALNDCINDLEWFSATGYLLIIKNTQCFLKNESSFNIVMKILDKAGEEWATPVINRGANLDRGAIPFHTVLETNSECFNDILIKLNNENISTKAI